MFPNIVTNILANTMIMNNMRTNSENNRRLNRLRRKGYVPTSSENYDDIEESDNTKTKKIPVILKVSVGILAIVLICMIGYLIYIS